MRPRQASIALQCGSRRTAITALALFIVLGVVVAYPKIAQTQESSPTPLTADDLSRFMDGLIPVQMRQSDIAGTVLVVVKDGKVLFSRGYGYADVESKKPVSPDSTLFRLASISKLFTCTAVMQLVEQGKLDLDADIAQYLDFSIPATYPQPITLRHLMTHTAGFQESIRGHNPEGGRLLPLKEYLPANLPPRIFPPGTTPAYSNYSNALAGYIVERVTAQPFEQYVEEHIFRPLSMKHSTYLQPLPDALKPMMSNGYVSGSEPSKPFQIVQTFPGGGMSATAQDVARFMIAHLQNGAFEDARFLKAETAESMHSRQFESCASMNGSTFGFAEQSRNGYRVLGHGGDLQCFHSQLMLVPELGVGFFFSQNSLGRANLRTTVWRNFFDRYFPRTAPASESAGSVTNASEFAGFYKSTRRFDLSIMKLGSLRSQIWVSAEPDGSIRCDLINNELGRPKTLREVAPMKYCDETGKDCLAFRRDLAGRPQLVGDFPHIVFERVPWYERRTPSFIVLIVSVVALALPLALWPIAIITRRHYRMRLEMPAAQRRRRMLVRIVCAIVLAFLVVGRALMLELPDPDLDFWVHLMQVVGIIGAFGTLVVVYDAIQSWKDPGRWWLSKVGSVVTALGCIGFVAFALVWNLFDFSTRY